MKITPRISVLYEKLTVAQPLNKFSAFYGNKDYRLHKRYGLD
jgi:hypothetical protein